MKMQIEIADKQLIQDNLQAEDAKEVILSMIDGPIKYYNSQFLKHWEKDHSISRETYDQKVAVLKEKKKEIYEMLEQASKEGFEVSVSVNLVQKEEVY
ncbi:hypothetical protein [Sediminitomix flava]|uniref:Uncharacterized protein n=1 Tax=Sediminitomix flava TaxID=379075 RepID=A0A315Z878_SEDFL|nr:hypothetical protein [Sediminitomix flava]PWJ41786.1 hypothetical protein BC781_10336 [Sediminitomix flava]